jgi:hypothetical protein
MPSHDGPRRATRARAKRAREAGWAVRPEVPVGGARRLPTRLHTVDPIRWVPPPANNGFSHAQCVTALRAGRVQRSSAVQSEKI